MEISRNKEAGTLTLVPIEPNEVRVVNDIIATLKPEGKLSYCGRGKDENYTVRLHVGGREERETQGKWTRSVYIGGIELVLCGTSESDKGEVANLGNICHFGGSELIFIGETDVDGKRSIIITPKRCKSCGKNIATLAECEWGICNVCATVCEHHYVNYFAHGEAGSLFYDEFCDKCGRSKTKENAGGIKILFKFFELGWSVGGVFVDKDQSENDQS